MSKEDVKEEDELFEEPKRWLRPKYIIPAVLLIAVLAALLFHWLQLRRNGYSRAELTAAYTVQAGSQASYASFAGGFLRYSSDGVSFISTEGQEKWNVSYSMNHPKLVTQGDCGAVADLNGRRVILFSKSGLSGSYNTNADILNLAVSEKGLTAIALDEGLTSLVQMYDNAGTRLDIEMSFEMSLSGYPLAMALSPDGTGLVISFVSSGTGALSSQIAFYNFAVGKSEPDRLMGFFKYDGSLFPQLTYLGADRVAAIGDASIEVFSLAQENKPERIKRILLPAQVSVCQTGSRHLGILYPDPSTGRQMMEIYDKDGALSFSCETEGSTISLRLEEGGVLYLSDAGLRLYSYAGQLRFSGSLTQSGQIVFLSGSRNLIQFDGSHLYRYRLK